MGTYLATLFVLPFSASFCYFLLLFLLITFIFTFLHHYHVFFFYGMRFCFLVWEAGLDYPAKLAGRLSYEGTPSLLALPGW